MDIATLSPAPDRPQILMQKAKELEGAFLAEMLTHIGMDSQSGMFSGGIGEEQFASFLRQSQAEALSERGGVGLAEMIFRSLMKVEEGADVRAFD